MTGITKKRRGEHKNQRAKQRNSVRRAEAAKAVAAIKRRSPADQLRELDRRLGVGKGAKREREVLAKRIFDAKKSA